MLTSCDGGEPEGKVCSLSPRPVLDGEWSDIIVVEQSVSAMDFLAALGGKAPLQVARKSHVVKNKRPGSEIRCWSSTVFCCQVDKMDSIKRLY